MNDKSIRLKAEVLTLIETNKRKVDIGIGLYGGKGNHIFCMEAKILPSSEYITSDTGAIKRFKKCQHGLSSSNPNIGRPLAYNGIIAYVKSGSFKDHFIKINEKIKELSEKHSHEPDGFDLAWNDPNNSKKSISKQSPSFFPNIPVKKLPMSAYTISGFM